MFPPCSARDEYGSIGNMKNKEVSRLRKGSKLNKTRKPN
jgi:hypothetical protein